MPLRIPSGLPARAVLRKENIFVLEDDVASSQEIRPLRLAILNLMPTKVATETQLLRLLGNSPLQVEVTLLRTASYESRNTDAGHLMAHYESLEVVRSRRFDGLIITGAPVEQMEFERVEYWRELCDIMAWASKQVASTLYICWGAQAGLYYRYGVPKHSLAKKKFGVFEHRVLVPSMPLFRGFDDTFMAPHSRYTETRRSDLEAVPEVQILSESDEAGVHMAGTPDGRHIFITGHFEYDACTLKAEYDRDVAKGLPIDVPRNYYPQDDPSRPPRASWRAHAHLLFSNWLNYYVYQVTSLAPGDRS